MENFLDLKHLVFTIVPSDKMAVEEDLVTNTSTYPVREEGWIIHCDGKYSKMRVLRKSHQ